MVLKPDPAKESPETVLKMPTPGLCLHPGIRLVFLFLFSPDPNSDSDVPKTTLSGKNDIVERATDSELDSRFRFKT